MLWHGTPPHRMHFGTSSSLTFSASLSASSFLQFQTCSQPQITTTGHNHKSHSGVSNTVRCKGSCWAGSNETSWLPTSLPPFEPRHASHLLEPSVPLPTPAVQECYLGPQRLPSVLLWHCQLPLLHPVPMTSLLRSPDPGFPALSTFLSAACLSACSAARAWRSRDSCSSRRRCRSANMLLSYGQQKI